MEGLAVGCGFGPGIAQAAMTNNHPPLYAKQCSWLRVADVCLQDCTAMIMGNEIIDNSNGSIRLDAGSVPLDPTKLQQDNKLDETPLVI